MDLATLPTGLPTINRYPSTAASDAAPAPEPQTKPKEPPPLVDAIPNNKDEPVLIISKSRDNMPNIAQHIENAQQRGFSARLHRGLGTEDFRNNQRRLALRGLGQPPATKSWDEYPFASTVEGGGNTSIEPVPINEQRVQGGVINAFYLEEALTYQDPFWVEIVP